MDTTRKRENIKTNSHWEKREENPSNACLPIVVADWSLCISIALFDEWRERCIALDYDVLMHVALVHQRCIVFALRMHCGWVSRSVKLAALCYACVIVCCVRVVTFCCVRVFVLLLLLWCVRLSSHCVRVVLRALFALRCAVTALLLSSCVNVRYVPVVLWRLCCCDRWCLLRSVRIASCLCVAVFYCVYFTALCVTQCSRGVF